MTHPQEGGTLVDWAEFTYEQVGVKRKLYGFAAILCYSRMRFVTFFSDFIASIGVAPAFAKLIRHKRKGKSNGQ